MLLSRPTVYTLFVLSVLVALPSYRFLLLDMSVAFQGMQQHIRDTPLFFLLHVSLAPAALLLAAFQFLAKRPPGNRTIHRFIGRFYGLCVLVAGVSGLVVAVGAKGGVVASTGFALLSVLWIYTTVQGVLKVRAGDITSHRRWMLRSFALTLAGVTLRLQLLGFMVAGIEYTEASLFLAWSCWVPNIIFVEWWMRRRAAAGLAAAAS